MIKNTKLMYPNGIIRFFVETSAKVVAKNIGIFFNGYIKIIPKTLNSRWAKATVTAARFPVAKEANIAVMVVPTLAPRV